MMHRRTVLAGLALALPLAAPHRARAQAPLKRIGWLSFGAAPIGRIDRTVVDALVQRGIVDGRTAELQFRYAQGNPERLPALAADLAALRPQILFGVGGDVVMALYNASRGIPVVGGVSDDPVRAGLADSLARPGRNMTGVTFLTDEVAAKRLQLLKETVPGAKRIAAIWNPQHFDNEINFARQAAKELDVVLDPFEVNDMVGLDRAFATIARQPCDGLFIIPSRLMSLHQGKLAEFALSRRLPMVAAWREFAAAGALLSYGPDRLAQARQLAIYVERVLGGARAADMPIEQASRFEMVVNLKTARAIGVTVPNSVLIRADEVIE